MVLPLPPSWVPAPVGHAGPIAFPPGYGYRVRWYDSWNLLVDLMNHSTTPKTVYVQVNYSYRPSWESVRRLRPVWLDIDRCGTPNTRFLPDSRTPHRVWTVNVPARCTYRSSHRADDGLGIMLGYVSPT